MKRRSGLILVAVLCVLTQLGLGASSALGLVLCIGADHTAVEMPSDDCCPSHDGTPGRAATIETSCCSDVPLVSVWRSLSELRRTDLGGMPAVAAVVAGPRPSSSAASVARLDAAPIWRPPPLVARPAILRV